MENRELSAELRMMWLRKHADHVKIGPPYMQRVKDMQRPTGEKFVALVIDPKPEVKIVTTSDIIRLTAKFAAGCALAMGAVVLVMMVAL